MKIALNKFFPVIPDPILEGFVVWGKLSGSHSRSSFLAHLSRRLRGSL